MTTAVSHFYTQRSDGNLSFVTGEDALEVAGNRHRVRNRVGSPVATVHQVHSTTVADVDNFVARCDGDLTAALADLALVPADAMVTTRTDIALGILTADCTPVLFADVTHGVYAAAHAGRKGTQNGIAAQTFHAMVAKGAQPETIEVWLGPSICGDCYETGDEVAADFARTFPNFVTTTRFGGAGIDLRAAVVSQLESLGILPESIHTRDAALGQHAESYNPMCTLENPDFFSYREWTLTHSPGSNGRFLSLLIPSNLEKVPA